MKLNDATQPSPMSVRINSADVRPRVASLPPHNSMNRITERRVISLPGSTRRERFVSQRAAKDFTFWDAFDGRSGAGLDRVDVPRFQARYHREPLGGEIGCLISHLTLLQHFANSPGKPSDLLLVAEDDAILGEDYAVVVDNVVNQKRFDWALLASPFEEAGESPFWSENRDRVALSWLASPVGPPGRRRFYRAGRWAGGLWGTGLYLVTRQGATLLTDYALSEERLWWLADDYESWHLPAGLDVHLIRPGLAGWTGGSEIHQTEGAHVFRQTRHPSRWALRVWARRVSRLRIAFSATRKSLRRGTQ